MTKKEAKRLSVLKWQYIVDNDGIEYGVHFKVEGLLGLQSNCGLCDKYQDTASKSLKYCAKCPIRLKVKDYSSIGNTGCWQDSHPYKIWSYNATKENAQAVLDLILKS